MMKFVHAALLLLAETRRVFGLPASSTAISVATSAPTLDPSCQDLCIRGYHSVYEPVIKKCKCVPDSKESKECLLDTICVEFDARMIPVWDDGIKKCSCKPKKDEVSKCLATTSCSIDFSPFWDPNTMKCACIPRHTNEQNCLRETICIETDILSVPEWDNVSKSCSCKARSDEDLETNTSAVAAKRDIVPRDEWTNKIPSAPTPTASINTCTSLKTFCECGDHHMHWSQQKQGCECPACPPVVSLGCEDLKIYCNGGDHHMHWDPIIKNCQCPAAKLNLRKPPIKHDDANEVLSHNELEVRMTPAPNPTPRADHCPLLKILCPCGDRHSHWNEDLQKCACQPCVPPPGIACENYKIYCPEGDHKMHWDPTTAKCQCLLPVVTDYAPEPLPTI